MRFDKPRHFRQSMSWLHTWAGLVLGWLLFAVFVTGTLAFFRNEITTWMQPELHSARDDGHGLERAVAVLARKAPDAQQWSINLQGPRSPVMTLSWREALAADERRSAGRRGEEGGDADSGLEAPGGRGEGAREGNRGHGMQGEGMRREGRRDRQEGTRAAGMQREGRGEGGRSEGMQREGMRTEGAPRQELRAGGESGEGDARPQRGGEGREMAMAAPQAEPAQAAARQQGGGGGGGGGQQAQNRLVMDPATGVILQPRQTAGGNFLYRFHFELYGMDRLTGRWIVGIATMFMFVAIISGVIVHRNIFKDFFTFRPGKGKRSWLDAHNATGVLSLPFHVVITFSGLLLLGFQLMPAAVVTAYDGDTRAMAQEMRGRGNANAPLPRPSGEKAALTPLTPLVAEAEREWPMQGVGAITITNPGDARATIEIRQARTEGLSSRGAARRLVFDGVTGEVLERPPVAESSAVSSAWNLMTALHMGRFASSLPRWLLFASGVLGSLMVASGLAMWVVARHKDRETLGRTPRGHRLVEVLNVAAVSGLLIAIAAYFWGNRLLPADLAERNLWEIRVFFSVWVLAALHAIVRKHKAAWVEQLTLAGVLTMLLPVLNGASGGVHLGHSLGAGQLQVAGFDTCALVLGALLMFAARKVSLHVPRVKPGAKSRPADASKAKEAEAVDELVAGLPVALKTEEA